MKFLERTQSNRIRKEQPNKGAGGRKKDETMVAEHQPRRDVFESIDEAVAEHRKSMGKRPNTSAGLEKRKRSTSKPRTAAQEAKEPTCSEDLQLAGQTLEYRDGLDTFVFPTPSPRLQPPPRSPTFQAQRSHSSSPLQHYESPRIGVAIGSPSHAPPSWGRSLTSDHISNRMPPSRAPPAPPEQTVSPAGSPDQKRKKSSWKTLGTIFRWTSKPPTTNQRPKSRGKQLQDQENVDPIRCTPPIRGLATSDATSPNLQSSRPVSSKAGHRRMRSDASMTRGMTRMESRAEADRTSFMPTLKARMNLAPTPRGSTLPSPRIKTHQYQDSADIFKPQERHDSPLSPDNLGIGTTPIPRTPRLDVNIERPEFERYSVMFENLLAKEQGSRPSLLERRQSRLQRKKSGKRAVGDGPSSEHMEIETKLPSIPQRSLTSPHLSASLSIRVDGKKVEVENVTAEGPSTAVNRPHPMKRSNTAPPGSVSPITAAFRNRKATLESSPESPGSATFTEVSMPTPTTVTTCTDTESVKRDLEQSEPAWDMMTSQPVTVASSSIQGSPESKQRRKTTDPYPRVTSPEDLERQMVQVSVARQVSVSRARSRVQRAVVTKQPLRPRVVELSKNRKSTVGVLESADDVPSMPTHSREASVASKKSGKGFVRAGSMSGEWSKIIQEAEKIEKEAKEAQTEEGSGKVEKSQTAERPEAKTEASNGATKAVVGPEKEEVSIEEQKASVPTIEVSNTDGETVKDGEDA